MIELRNTNWKNSTTCDESVLVLFDPITFQLYDKNVPIIKSIFIKKLYFQYSFDSGINIRLKTQRLTH